MMDWTQLRLGYRLGMCSILGLWVAWDCIWGQFAKDEISIGGRSAFPVFRGCFGLICWHWFWGMSVYIWSRYRWVQRHQIELKTFARLISLTINSELLFKYQLYLSVRVWSKKHRYSDGYIQWCSWWDSRVFIIDVDLLQGKPTDNIKTSNIVERYKWISLLLAIKGRCWWLSTNRSSWSISSLLNHLRCQMFDIPMEDA
jgi:hypothetical protein